MTIAATFEIEYLQYLGPDGKPVARAAARVRATPRRCCRCSSRCCSCAPSTPRRSRCSAPASSAPTPACLGHEATHVGIGASMQPDDVFAPSYREYGAQFMRGVKPREVLLYWGGDERGNDFSGPTHDYSWCVPIATQCLHAAGAALAFKLRKRDARRGGVLRRRRLVEDRLLRRDQFRRRLHAAVGAVHHQQRLGDLGAALGADRRARRWRRRASPAACIACRSTATT